MYSIYTLCTPPRANGNSNVFRCTLLCCWSTCTQHVLSMYSDCTLRPLGWQGSRLADISNCFQERSGYSTVLTERLDSCMYCRVTTTRHAFAQFAIIWDFGVCLGRPHTLERLRRLAACASHVPAPDARPRSPQVPKRAIYNLYDKRWKGLADTTKVLTVAPAQYHYQHSDTKSKSRTL